MGIRKIWVGQADGPNEKPLLEEGLVVDAFLPGTLVVKGTAGLATSTKSATVFNSEALVAIEQGANVGAVITTPWVVGETGKAIQVLSGQSVAIRVAAGNNITAPRTALSSNGDGTFKIAATDGTEQILFYADQVVNVTAVQLVFAIKA